VLFRGGRRDADVEGAVVTLELEGEGVEAAEDDEAVFAAVEVIDIVEGSGVPVEDIVCRV
jgi:hypothetical protein